MKRICEPNRPSGCEIAIGTDERRVIKRSKAPTANVKFHLNLLYCGVEPTADRVGCDGARCEQLLAEALIDTVGAVGRRQMILVAGDACRRRLCDVVLASDEIKQAAH